MLVFSGKTTLEELFGGNIFYRDLNPVSSQLPRFEQILTDMGLKQTFPPRKTSEEYTRIILRFLQLSTEKSPAQILFLGDTPGNDGSVIRHLAKWSGSRVFGFIGQENLGQPPSFEKQPPLFLANRWNLIAQFLQEIQAEGFDPTAPTAVFLDMDKTMIGARGRNDAQIDAARMDGVRNLIREILMDRWDDEQFFFVYKTFNQADYHFLTEDNQDYLAFICLTIMAGVWNFDELLQLLVEQKVTSFTTFLNRTGARILQAQNKLIQRYFEEVLTGTSMGDPTPFKSFRYKEYEATIARLDQSEFYHPEQLIHQEILLTKELVDMVRILKEKPNFGPFFCISDKPPESTFPPPGQESHGALPLHKIPIKIVGTDLTAQLQRLL